MLHGFPKEATEPFFPDDGTSWSWVRVQWLPEPPRLVFSATFSWSREVFAFIHVEKLVPDPMPCERPCPGYRLPHLGIQV